MQPYDYTRGQYRAIPHYTFTDHPNGGLRSTARDMRAFPDSLTNSDLLVMNRRLGLWGHDGGAKGEAELEGVLADAYSFGLGLSGP